MKLVIMLFFSSLALAQQSATTSAPCSPIAPDNTGTITINCPGMSKEQGQKMLAILNKILANQLDPDVVIGKLDEIEKELQGVAKSIPRSRVMSEPHLQVFTSALNETIGGIRVIIAGSSDDVYPLAKQLCEAAKQAKWNYACPRGRNSVMAGEPEIEGLECYTADWHSEDALVFKQAMKAADLLCTFVPHQWTPRLSGAAIISGYDFSGGMPSARAITILIGRQSR
jgi:hypothetical protein